MDSRAEAGFADFMRGRWSALVRLGYGLTGDLRLAEALARSAFATAYASWPRVLRAGDPNVYVCRAMLNASLDRFRGRRAQRPGPELPRGRGTDRQAPNGGDRPALVAALMRLPASQRSVVLLRYWMDMTEAEVATALGCSVGSVRNQAFLALAALRAGQDMAGETVLMAGETVS
jgi:RNA polymerase sigma-70 factor (sigma-E family)